MYACTLFPVLLLLLWVLLLFLLLLWMLLLFLWMVAVVALLLLLWVLVVVVVVVVAVLFLRFDCVRAQVPLRRVAAATAGRGALCVRCCVGPRRVASRNGAPSVPWGCSSGP